MKDWDQSLSIASICIFFFLNYENEIDPAAFISFHTDVTQTVWQMAISIQILKEMYGRIDGTDKVAIWKFVTVFVVWLMLTRIWTVICLKLYSVLVCLQAKPGALCLCCESKADQVINQR